MKKRLKPKMIFFDYGLTLLNEPDFNSLRGDLALFQYIIENPNQVSAEEIGAFARRAFLAAEPARTSGFEIHEHTLLRFVNDSLGLRYSLTIEEQERVFWENASTMEPMPHIEQLLQYLSASGIRTAVVSNISFSGEALRRRIDAALPDNHFEFVVASSDYGVRKPNPLIFQVALQKAGIAPKDVWFCGDNFQADIIGALGAGMFPVWYHGESKEENQQTQVTDSDCLTINDWPELVDVLKE